jgi:hypothetical protein
LPRIDDCDLNLFEFDYDVTFMVFFLSADERVYGRFGGRDAKGPDSRMSLAGLHYAMAGALETHNRGTMDPLAIARQAPKFIRDVRAGRGLGRGCLHCHQVKERLNAELERSGKWTRDLVWRYPLPDNLGLLLEVDRGNVVERVDRASAADRAGLRAGDVIRQLNGVAVHSFADAQYALDRAPVTGVIATSWQRDDTILKGKLALPEGWRKTDISWRQSMQKFVPSPRLYGNDLSAKEKEARGLSSKQLAFRQEEGVHSQARDAGIRAGDIVLGLDDKKLEMDVNELHRYVYRNYLRGDWVAVNILRDGERLRLPMLLR